MIETAASPDELRAARRFTRIVIAIVLLGLAGTSTLAVAVDPLHVFGISHVRSILTSERDDKPISFLAREPAPQAIVMGSSRAMKLRPACITELTGLPAYNFGLSNGLVEDMVAVLGFVRARGHAPLREIVIGLDVEMFDDRTPPDPRLLSARELQPYIPGSTSRSWATLTQALFGWQAFRYGLLSVRYEVFPNSRPDLDTHSDPDGLVRYDEYETAMANKTFSLATQLDPNVHTFATAWSLRGFGHLSKDRLAMFRDLVTRAHADGAEIHVMIPPIHHTLEDARADGPALLRTHELDRELRALADQGVIHYLSISSAKDFGGDVEAYYDGVHLTEANATRMLVAAFGRTTGCGI